MIHVKTDEMYGKNSIVNSNDFRKHIVSMDSQFRKSPLDGSTDFLYAFAHSYKNIIQARVASVEIPMGVYAFSAAKKNTSFTLQVNDVNDTLQTIVVTIADGNYRPATLVDAIQAQFVVIKNQYGVFFTITYHDISGTVHLTHTGSASAPNPVTPTRGPTPFVVSFPALPHRGGLGFHLGFTKPMYSLLGPYDVGGESIVQTNLDSYFLLAVEDWYTVDHKTTDTYVQCLAKIIVKPTPMGVVFDDGYTVLSNEITFPRPTDLKQVRVRLLDKYGVPLDMKGVNFSLSLEITEVMNVQLYDNYRQYLWNGSDSLEPSKTALQARVAVPSVREQPITDMRVVRNIGGGAAPFASPGRSFT